MPIEPVVTRLEVPPGMLGPDPVSIEVRCFIIVGTDRVVLVDAGPPGTGAVIGEALERAGAGWSDVSDIVLTHSHFDHVGGLSEAAGRAAGARIWAGTDDAGAIPVEGGRAVLPLLEGDLVGSSDGELVFGPSAFTADPSRSRESLQRMVGLEPRRMLFSHGAEVPDPTSQVLRLLASI